MLGLLKQFINCAKQHSIWHDHEKIMCQKLEELTLPPACEHGTHYRNDRVDVKNAVSPVS